MLNTGLSYSIWNVQMNAGCLWCWCEYSKLPDKLVQRWRSGTNNEVEGLWQQVISFITITLKKCQHQVETAINLGISKDSREYNINVEFNSLCLSCIAHAIWWNKSWKSAYLDTSGTFWNGRWGPGKEDHYRWWYLKIGTHINRQRCL